MLKDDHMDVHTVPRDDVIQHIDSIWCPCDPWIIPEDAEHYRQVIHKALDGREWVERAQKILGIDREEEN